MLSPGGEIRHHMGASSLIAVVRYSSSISLESTDCSLWYSVDGTDLFSRRSWIFESTVLNTSVDSVKFLSFERLRWQSQIFESAVLNSCELPETIAVLLEQKWLMIFIESEQFDSYKQVDSSCYSYMNQVVSIQSNLFFIGKIFKWTRIHEFSNIN